jgi:serine/threonine-protein kinase
MPVSPRQLRTVTEGASPFPPDCARKFQAVSELAAGGFGTVWLAVQKGLDRKVAIKLLHVETLADPEQRQRFALEARVTSRLSGPHVVHVLDFGLEDDGVPWIAYEYCAGKSLRARLDAGPLAPAEALDIAGQVAEALQEAHALEVLHRDVKPENVLESDGRYKLTDFGIAKWTQGAEVRTKTGIVLGTPAYLAPEVITGEKPSPRSDVYALGIMLYEMLAGRLPFTDQNPVMLMERHLRSAARRPSELRAGLPAHLDELVLRALAKKPEERFASAGEMAAALKNSLRRPGGAEPPAGAPPVRPPSCAGTGPASRPTLAVRPPEPAPAGLRPAAVVAAGLLAIGGVFLAGRTSAPRAPAPSPSCVASPAPAAPPSVPPPPSVAGLEAAFAERIDALVDAVIADPRRSVPLSPETLEHIAVRFQLRFTPIAAEIEELAEKERNWRSLDRERPESQERLRAYLDFLRVDIPLKDPDLFQRLLSWRTKLGPEVRRAVAYLRALAKGGASPAVLVGRATVIDELAAGAYAAGNGDRPEFESLVEPIQREVATSWCMAFLVGLHARRTYWIEPSSDRWVFFTAKAVDQLVRDVKKRPELLRSEAERLAMLRVVVELANAAGGMRTRMLRERPRVDWALSVIVADRKQTPAEQRALDVIYTTLERP